MNFKELKELIDIISSKEGIEEFEIERAGVRLKIKRAANHFAPTISEVIHPFEKVIPSISAPAVQEKIPAETEPLHYVTSPIVGTFYRAPAPTSDPFVNVGDFVEKGSVLCIIEAMKLMNEIESDIAGEVVNIFVESGRPVEYGEKLFAIRPRQRA